MKGFKLVAVVSLYTVFTIFGLSARGHQAYQHPSHNNQAPSNRAEGVDNPRFVGGSPPVDGCAVHLEIINDDPFDTLLHIQIRLVYVAISVLTLAFIYRYIRFGNSVFGGPFLGNAVSIIGSQLGGLVTTLLADVLYRRLNQNVGVVGPRAPVARNNNAISGNPTPGINEAAPTTGGPDINSRHDVGPSHRVHDGQAHGELVSSAGSTHLQPYSDPSASGSQTSSEERLEKHRLPVAYGRSGRGDRTYAFVNYLFIRSEHNGRAV
ncbi:hypothetical protein SeLEV6574_g01593 [Synchytrium endobioticum]|uniref:Uncharacterized protein n=1 Tax=Synchytrium endobioticum TaxID=286115 RepID=A0A507DC88_9FUNG|nr:hypothetical protein SeLEV6574_g01593 [Synchytrium endobioticum]